MFKLIICITGTWNSSIVDHGKTGIVINHAKELNVALERILNDSELLDSMSIEGRKLALRKFDQDLVAQSYMAVYREVGWS